MAVKAGENDATRGTADEARTDSDGRSHATMQLQTAITRAMRERFTRRNP